MPPKKGKGNTAKRGRQAKNAEKIDAPPAKKRSLGNAAPQEPSRASSVSSATSVQPKITQVIDLEDDDAMERFRRPEPMPNVKSNPQPKNDICAKPEPIRDIYIKPVLRPKGYFPRFKDGDVIIEVQHASSKFTYQLHGNVLQRASPWFEEALRINMAEFEPDPQLVENHAIAGMMWARFEMKYCPELKQHVLARSVFGFTKDAEQNYQPFEQPIPISANIGNDLNADAHVACSPSLQPMEANGIIEKIQESDVPVSGGRDGRLGDLRDAVVQEKYVKTEYSALAPPTGFEDDPVAKQQGFNDDFVMPDASAVDLEAKEMATECSVEAGKDQIPANSDKSSTEIVIAAVEELQDAPILGKFSDASVAEVSKAEMETQTATKIAVSSSPDSQAAVEHPFMNDGEFRGRDTTQDLEVGATMKQEEHGPAGITQALKATEPHPLRNENHYHDVFESVGADAVVGFIGKTQAEVVESPIPMKEDFSDAVSPPRTESPEIKEEETQTQVAAQSCESLVIQQEIPVAGMVSRALVGELAIERETSYMPTLAADVLAELLREKEDGNIPHIPQGDGPSEDGIPKRHPKRHPTSLRVTRQQCCSEDSHRGSQVAAIKEMPTLAHNHNESSLENAEQLEVFKKRSVSVLEIHERQRSSDASRMSITEEKPPNLADAPVDAPEMIIDPAEDMKATPMGVADKPAMGILNAYNNLFLIYYSREPSINTQDIGIALQQSEFLIGVARLYSSVPLVRPYINSALMQFGRELYMAIMADPPRWIHLAMDLESAPIFREGIIHIVANHPYWPWPTLGFSDLFSSVAELIEEKTYAFVTLKKSVNTSLFLNAGPDVEVFSRPLDEDDFDTWVVVQYWRDWFSRSLAQANRASEDSQKCARGKLYRDLYRNGEGYLPTILVLDAVAACRSKDLFTKSKRQGIEQDLKTLKDFAQEEVQTLCANYSMLSVEDAGIDYLTCVKVENDELPWVKSKRN